MNLEEKQYLDILKNILENWVKEIDRTWVGTLYQHFEKKWLLIYQLEIILY